MKTLEFKLTLTKSQQRTIDDWLSALKYPWNRGVWLIKRFNEFNRYDKRFKQSAPCCPITSYNHQLRLSNPKRRVESEVQPVVMGQLKESEFLSCPIGWEVASFNELEPGNVTLRTPSGVYPVQLEKDGHPVNNLTIFGLQPIFTHKRNQDRDWLTCVPSKFIDGTVQTLADSWQAFLAGQRKPPKFKGKNDRIDTLLHNNSKSIRIKGDRINIPNLGYVRAKGLSKRWPAGVPFCPLKICRKASGYYLQLSGDIDKDDKALVAPKVPKVPSAGFDPGIAFVYSDDKGRQVKVPDYLERDMRKLKILQRKAQKQWDLNHGLTLSQIGDWHPPLIDLPWQRKNWKRTQKAIAKIHEKIARRGRAFNHFQSTKIVRQFQQIYLEDYKVSEIVGKVAPVDSGKVVINSKDELTTIYDKNGRKLNRLTNKAALRNRVGQLWTMIETKGGKRVVRVERAGTSDECPKCGYIEEKLLKQRTHRCKQCGYVAPRDVAAAQVIKKRGLAQGIEEEKPKKEKRKRYGKKKSEGEAV